MKPSFGELKEVLNEMPSGTKILTVKNDSASTFFEKMGVDRWMWLHPISDGKPSSFDKIVDPHTEVYVVWTPQDGVKGNHDMCAQLRWDTGDVWMFVHPNGEASSSLPVLTEREAKKLGYEIPVFSEEVGQRENRSAVMTEFKASNGYVIKTHTEQGDCWIFDQNGNEPLTYFDCLQGEETQALREFFSQERDEELPFRYGGCWVLPIGGTDIRRVVVVGRNTYTAFVEGRIDIDTVLAAAAQAYFAAHPKPKPWLDAQTGDVWSISDGYAGGLAVCRREPEQGSDDDDDHPVFYGPDFDGIRGDALTAGTWLDVQL